MLTLRDGLRIFVSLMPVDMRKSINGLVAIVVDEFDETPQSGHLFLFYNKHRDKVKIVYWDRNGFILHYKRLSKVKFKFSKAQAADIIEIKENQLHWLLAGLDFQLMHQFNEINYSNYY